MHQVFLIYMVFPNAMVKLLPYDHRVISSSTKNNLLLKYKKILRA
jgi:hypothetical protein